MFKVTKYPFFFFFMQDCANSKIEDNFILIKDIKYELKAKNIFVYLIIRFLPIFIFFIFTFNEFDFALTNEKIIQYILSISIFLIILFFKNIGFILGLSIMLTIGILSIGNYFEFGNMLLPYIFKYLIFIYAFYEFYLSSKFRFFEILENNKLKAHLIIKE